MAWIEISVVVLVKTKKNGGIGFTVSSKTSQVKFEVLKKCKKIK
jgi:hypothetical protein